MRRLYARAATITVALTLAGAWCPSDVEAQRRRGRELRVAVVLDGPAAAYEASEAAIKTEVEALAAPGSRAVVFPDDARRVADHTESGVAAALDAVYGLDDIGVVIAIGAISTQVLAGRDALPIPTLLPVVVHGQQDDLPRQASRSGMENFSYVLGFQDLEADLTRFRDIARMERVELLFFRPVFDAAPRLAPEAVATAEHLGLSARAQGVDLTAESVLAAIPADAQAVYLGPLVTLPEAELATLIEALSDRGTASFSGAGPEPVQAGVLASVADVDDVSRRARRLALYVDRVARGENPSRFAVDFETHQQLVINVGTARATGVYPPFSVLIDAEVVGQRRSEVDRNLTLDAAIAEAVERNYDLRVQDQAVRVGQQQVVAARAPLLPSIDASVTGALIDEDRAAGLGSPGQLSASWTIEAQQVIFSEAAWAGFRAQERAQEAVLQDRETIRLDIILEVANAYLGVLQTMTAERVQLDNLRVSRENLALARIRNAVGSAGRADIYRWEAAIANSQQQVIDASAQRNQAEIELNRVMVYPLEEPFLLREAALDDPFDMVGSYRPVFRYLDNPWSFRVFRAFMAEEAIRNSPELRALDANIAAVRRQLEGFERSLWLPTIALAGSLTHNFFNEGGGNPQQGIDPIPGFPEEFTAGFGVDAFEFQVGLTASLSLFAGGQRYASIRQSEAQLAQLEEQRASAAQLVEQRVRAAMHGAGARYASVGLSRRAADATGRNLELVQRSYSEGATTIITLIDAQNEALEARLAAENAIYAFLLQAYQVERAAGRFRLNATDEERRDFRERLQAFAEERGVSVPPPPPEYQDVTSASETDGGDAEEEPEESP